MLLSYNPGGDVWHTLEMRDADHVAWFIWVNWMLINKATLIVTTPEGVVRQTYSEGQWGPKELVA